MHVRARHVLRGHGRLTLGSVERGTRIAVEREVAAEAHRCDSRNGAKTFEECAAVHGRRRRRWCCRAGSSSGRRSLRARNADVQRQHRIGIEAGIECRQISYRPNHQAGAHQQDDGQRQLHHDERGPQPLRSAPVAAACVFLERGGQIHRPRLQSRREPDEHAARERHSDRKSRDPHVEARRHEAWKRHWTPSEESRDSHARQEQANDGAEHREHAALGHQLPEQPGAARAERGPHGHLAPAVFRSRDQEVCHIRTRDEQHERDGCQQGEQGWPQRADELDVERTDFHRAFLVGGGIRSFELP